MNSLLNKWIKKNFDVNARQDFMNKFAILQPLQHFYSGLSSKSKWIIPGVSILLLTSVIYSLHNQTNDISSLKTSGTKQTHAIINQLDDMRVQLEQLSASPKNSDSYREAQANITDDLSKIKIAVNDIAKASDVKKVAQQITFMQGDMDDQMLDLKRTLAAGDSAKQYLDPKVLPFHVISIDVISQQPFVSIDYAHHVTPFTIGDAVAGWQISDADYATGLVEFKNTRDQYVKVTLQG